MDELKLFFYALGIVIAIFLTRAIYSIPAILRNLKWQTKILEKIAEKHGVTDDELQSIRNDKEPQY